MAFIENANQFKIFSKTWSVGAIPNLFKPGHPSCLYTIVYNGIGHVIIIKKKIFFFILLLFYNSIAAIKCIKYILLLSVYFFLQF